MAIGTQTVDDKGEVATYENTSTEDNEECIVTSDVSRFNTFELMTVTGAADVLISLNGTDFATAAHSLVDQGASDSVPVLVTVAGRIYGFRGLPKKIKVLQNGATDVQVVLRCGRI